MKTAGRFGTHRSAVRASTNRVLRITDAANLDAPDREKKVSRRNPAFGETQQCPGQAQPRSVRVRRAGVEADRLNRCDAVFAARGFLRRLRLPRFASRGAAGATRIRASTVHPRKQTM